jgi:hypothetical protein
VDRDRASWLHGEHGHLSLAVDAFGAILDELVSAAARAR